MPWLARRAFREIFVTQFRRIQQKTLLVIELPIDVFSFVFHQPPKHSDIPGQGGRLQSEEDPRVSVCYQNQPLSITAGILDLQTLHTIECQFNKHIIYHAKDIIEMIARVLAKASYRAKIGQLYEKEKKHKTGEEYAFKTQLSVKENK